MRGAIAKKTTVEGKGRSVYKARTLAVKYTKGWEVLRRDYLATLKRKWQISPSWTT